MNSYEQAIAAGARRAERERIRAMIEALPAETTDQRGMRVIGGPHWVGRLEALAAIGKDDA